MEHFFSLIHGRIQVLEGVLLVGEGQVGRRRCLKLLLRRILLGLVLGKTSSCHALSYRIRDRVTVKVSSGSLRLASSLG